MSVLILITHFQTNLWLDQCISSIMEQTMMPDHILVVDDCSENPPISACEKYPQITFMQTTTNGGPFRIQQTVFEQTEYTHILLQDDDDWSHPNRLKKLFSAMKEDGLDMVGSQMKYYYEYESGEKCPQMPLDPKLSLLDNPLGHYCMLSSCLINRNFFLRLGGLSTRFRFGADSEFVRRAVLGGKVLNLPEILYYRRIHKQSLTHHPDTGFGSPARKKVQRIVQNAAMELAEKVRSGAMSAWQAVLPGETAELRHLSGPKIPGL